MATTMTKTALVRAAGGETGTHEQAVGGVSGPAGGHGDQRDQEERRLCNSRARPSGEGGAESAHGPQPADGRTDQDQGQDGGEVPRGEVGEGLDRAPKEVASGSTDF